MGKLWRNTKLTVLAFMCFILCFVQLAHAGDRDVSSRQYFEGRPYIIDAPSEHESREKMPIIIVLHGATGNALTMKRSIIHNMRLEMEKHGFLVAYLSGNPGGLSRRRRTWNAGVCCGPAEWRHKNDVGYIKGFIRHAIDEHNADPKRIYMMGFSNGAMMAYRYVCEYPQTVTAIVAISGTLMSDSCKPHGLKGVLHIHGGDDLVVPIEGGVSKVGLFRREYYTPVGDVSSLMKDAGVPFKLRFLEAVGHQFDVMNERINLAATSWRFFSGHSR